MQQFDAMEAVRLSLTIVVSGEARPVALGLLARGDLLRLHVCVALQAVHCGERERTTCVIRPLFWAP